MLFKTLVYIFIETGLKSCLLIFFLRTKRYKPLLVFHTERLVFWRNIKNIIIRYYWNHKLMFIYFFKYIARWIKNILMKTFCGKKCYSWNFRKWKTSIWRHQTRRYIVSRILYALCVKTIPPCNDLSTTFQYFFNHFSLFLCQLNQILIMIIHRETL